GDLQAAAVAQQHVLDDGQAEAGAAGAGGAAGVDAVEALGEPRQVPGLDADAVVRHAAVAALLVGPPAQADLAAVGAVLHRIEHQVGEGAAQLLRAALEAYPVVRLEADAMVAWAGQGLGVVAD